MCLNLFYIEKLSLLYIYEILHFLFTISKFYTYLHSIDIYLVTYMYMLSIVAVMVSIGGQTHTAQPIKVTTSEGESMQMQILTADNLGTFLTTGGTHLEIFHAYIITCILLLIRFVTDYLQKYNGLINLIDGKIDKPNIFPKVVLTNLISVLFSTTTYCLTYTRIDDQNTE